MSARRFRAFVIAFLTTVPLATAALAGTSLAATGGHAKVAAQCRDGIDNDGDGLIDLGQDPGCFSPNDNTEQDSPPQCSDGVDNDGDGLTDFPNDPGCVSPDDILESNQPAPQCSDGFDNDNDGFADFPNDPGCFSPTDNSEKTH